MSLLSSMRRSSSRSPRDNDASPRRTSSSPPLQMIEARPGRRTKKRLFSLKRRVTMDIDLPESPRSPRSSHKLHFSSSPKSSSANIDPTLSWIQTECPVDLVPKILSFCGPQTVAALSQTSRAWRARTQSQRLWKVLCEDYCKWSDGDAVPKCWKEHYRINPCVPLDYQSIHTALAVATDMGRKSSRQNINPTVLEQHESIRILLSPGQYVLRKAVSIHSSCQVTIESLPASKHFCSLEDDCTMAAAAEAAKKRKSIRNYLSCRYSNTVLEDVAVHDDEEELEEEEDQDFALQEANVSRFHSSALPSRATLVLKTRRHNEPIFRVRQGDLVLKNLELRHNCHGTDIWNGNAAVQVQPPLNPQDDSVLPVTPRPRVTMDSIEVVSKSGRGVVAIDGGCAMVQRCFIHDCAATGVYVGGQGTQATLQECDVVANGMGSRHRRGVGRGHSGIYLEQGNASIQNCNISRNSLTGISAISPQNAFLQLEESDLLGNGSMPLEMPPVGTESSRRSHIARNNLLRAVGSESSRSGLFVLADDDHMQE